MGYSSARGDPLTPTETEALRRLLARHPMRTTQTIAEMHNNRAWLEGVAAHAADDVARHGLRLCALPGCGAREAHPKHFKLCGRCRRVVYCSPAHQSEDWKRHKRADGGCKEAPGTAAADES